MTDRVAVLYLGRMAEWGPTREVFARPYHPYTPSLIAAEPQADPRKRRADLALKGEIPSVLAQALGLRIPYPLPAGAPALRGGGAAAPHDHTGPHGAMPFCRRNQNRNQGGKHGTDLEH